MRPSRCLRHGIAALIGAIAVFTAAAAEHAPPTGEPFSTEPAVVMPVDDVSTVSIVGIQGQISVATREERELQVISLAAGNDGTAVPVGYWLDGTRLIIAPVPGGRNGARRLFVEVPKGLGITVDAIDSELTVLTEGGTVDVRGDKVRATLQAIGATVVADMVSGTLNVRDSKDAMVRVKGTATTIGAMTGSVTVRASGGTVTVGAVAGATEVESEDSRLAFDGLTGPLHVNAKKGEAKITGIQAGAELELAGTPLELKAGKGNITVVSDAPVVFKEMAASMHFDMEGASVQGKGNDGILEVRGRHTSLNVESIAGGTRVQGDGLTVKLVDLGGELQLEATASEVAIDGAGSIVLRVDRGSVAVQRAAGAIQANVTGGDVRIVDVAGPVNLELDRGEGEVSWTSFTGDKDSSLVSAGGNLTVRFPVNGGCRVEAKSTRGRVDSELPTVLVLEGGNEAQGPVNNGYRPIVRVTAAGDIHLLGPATAP